MPIAVCVSPSFSFSSTAGQRRWDFRSDFHRLTAKSYLHEGSERV
jgi:hypothetical protein